MIQILEASEDERRECGHCREQLRCLVRLNRLEAKLLVSQGAGQQTLGGETMSSVNPNRVAKLNRLIRELHHNLARK